MKKITLTNGGYTLIDDADFVRVSERKWLKTSHGYVKSTTKDGEYLHRFLLGLKKGEIADHINRDKSDNRLSVNLRRCTRSENYLNSPPRLSNKSGFKGVYKNNHGRRKNKVWQASTQKTVDGVSKRIFIGYFATAEEAAKAYDKKIKELFGEFAWLNFPHAQ